MPSETACSGRAVGKCVNSHFCPICIRTPEKDRVSSSISVNVVKVHCHVRCVCMPIHKEDTGRVVGKKVCTVFSFLPSVPSQEHQNSESKSKDLINVEKCSISALPCEVCASIQRAVVESVPSTKGSVCEPIK